MLKWVALGIALVVVAAGVLAYVVDERRDGSEFDAAEWRKARASAGDSDEKLTDLADAAVASDALIGRRYSELERMLGEPDRVLTSEPPYWQWTLGVVNDYFGPGDTATLTVHFNRSGRSDKAERSP